MRGPEHLLRSPPSLADQKTHPRVFGKYADSQAPPRPTGPESPRERLGKFGKPCLRVVVLSPRCIRDLAGDPEKPEVWVTAQDNHIRLLGRGADTCCFLKFVCWFHLAAMGFSEKDGCLVIVNQPSSFPLMQRKVCLLIPPERPE